MTPQEALRHAYAADIARLPPEYQGRYDADEMVQEFFSTGPGERHSELAGLSKIGHPDFAYSSEGEDDPAATEQYRRMQDQMLQGYSGDGWTPAERKALGRDPEPYEYSPGRRMRNEIDTRQRLYEALTSPSKPSVAAWGGDPSKLHAGHAKLYADDIQKKYGYLPGTGPGTWFPGIPDEGFSAFINPENSVGTLTTQMGSVLADGASQLATAMLRGTDAMEAPANAAVRAGGADWNRTSPQLTNDRGWRENNALIKQQREAYRGSEGMDAEDTFRQTIGNNVLPENWNGKVPYIQPLINGAMSLGNSFFDGTGLLASTKVAPKLVGPAAKLIAKAPVPGVKQFAQSTVDDMAKFAQSHPTFGQKALYNIQDESLDPGTVAGGVQEFLYPNENETRTEWENRQAQNDQTRAKSVKLLENNAGEIVPQKPYGITGAIRKSLIDPIVHPMRIGQSKM